MFRPGRTLDGLLAQGMTKADIRQSSFAFLLKGSASVVDDSKKLL